MAFKLILENVLKMINLQSICRLCALFFFLVAFHKGNAQVTLYSESFETDGEGSRYFTNTYSFCNTPPNNNNPDYFPENKYKSRFAGRLH